MLLSHDSTHHLLKPIGLDLVVKKSILPSDARLPRSHLLHLDCQGLAYICNQLCTYVQCTALHVQKVAVAYAPGGQINAIVRAYV